MSLSIFDALRIATESLGEQIHVIPSPTTFFYNFVTRGQFKKNSGVNQTTFKAGRVEPTSSTDGWADVTLSNNVPTGGNCDTTFLDVDVGFDEATFAPRKVGLAGPIICRDRLTYAHNPMDFIKLYVRQLSNYVKRKVDLEFRNQTIKLGNKLVIRPGGLDSLFTGTTLPTIAPNSSLTFSWLADVAAYMIRDGAANAEQDVIEMGPDGPIFPLVLGLEQIPKLVQATSGQGTRTDFQYANMGKGPDSDLLAKMGATRVIGNFRVIPEAFPPRYDLVNGVLVERQAFESTAATHGNKSTVTSAYKNAQYEAAIIPHKLQFKADIVSPENAGLEFDAANYTGEWKFVTGGRELSSDGSTFDPLHDYARHYAKFIYAPEPIHTNYGWALFYKRDIYGNQNTAASTYVG
jgi:hypothetical protein